MMQALDMKGCSKKADRHGFENFYSNQSENVLFRSLDLEEVIDLHIPSKDASYW